MPKEAVYGEFEPFEPNGPARSVVELGWSREASHVQLASKCIRADDHSTFIPDDVEAVIEKVQPVAEREARYAAVMSGEVATVPSPTDLEPDLRSLTCFEGFYVQLDRRGINELIKKLRRARDQAFGKDE